MNDADEERFQVWVASAIDAGALECSVGMARAVWSAAVAAERERAAQTALRLKRTTGPDIDPDDDMDWQSARIAAAIREARMAGHSSMTRGRDE